MGCFSYLHKSVFSSKKIVVTKVAGMRGRGKTEILKARFRRMNRRYGVLNFSGVMHRVQPFAHQHIVQPLAGTRKAAFDVRSRPSCELADFFDALLTEIEQFKRRGILGAELVQGLAEQAACFFFLQPYFIVVQVFLPMRKRILQRGPGRISLCSQPGDSH